MWKVCSPDGTHPRAIGTSDTGDARDCGLTSMVWEPELQKSRVFGAEWRLISAGWIMRFRRRKFGGFACGEEHFGGFGTPFVPGAPGLVPDPLPTPATRRKMFGLTSMAWNDKYVR